MTRYRPTILLAAAVALAVPVACSEDACAAPGGGTGGFHAPSPPVRVAPPAPRVAPMPRVSPAPRVAPRVSPPPRVAPAPIPHAPIIPPVIVDRDPHHRDRDRRDDERPRC